MEGGIIELLGVWPGEAKDHPAAAFCSDRYDLPEQLRQSGRHCLVLRPGHREHNILGCHWSAIVPACAGVEIEDEGSGITPGPGLRQPRNEVGFF
jgi:hypothetical protein